MWNAINLFRELRINENSFPITGIYFSFPPANATNSAAGKNCSYTESATFVTHPIEQLLE